MALTLEDGTGRADAESFVSTAEISTWASARGLSFTTDPIEQEICARKAIAYLCNGIRFRKWRGDLLNSLQALPYPRKNVITEDGAVLPDGTIPLRLKWAQCSLSVMSSNGVDLQPTLKQGGAMVVSSSVGPISKTYAQSVKQPIYSPFPAENLLTEVIGYLAPLLSLYDDTAEVTFVEGEVPSGYQSQTFQNIDG